MRKLTMVAMAALALGGCNDRDKQSKAAPAETHEKLAEKPKPVVAEPAEVRAPAERVLAGVRAFNRGDYEGALRDFADDVRFTVVAGPETTRGKDAIIRSFKETKMAFPDLEVAVERIVTGRDRVAAHLVTRGTHTGEYMGHAATGKEVGTGMLWVFENGDDEITGVTVYANTMAYLSQIGKAPQSMPPVPLPAFPSGEPQSIAGEPEPQNIAVVKAWYRSLEDQTAAAKVDQMLTENAVHHVVGEGRREQGRETAKKTLAAMSEQISDLKLSAVQYESIGDWVVARGKWSGKRRVADKPQAEHERFAVDFVEFIRVENGVLAESWDYFNPVQMVTPEPSETKPSDEQGEKKAPPSP